MYGSVGGLGDVSLLYRWSALDGMTAYNYGFTTVMVTMEFITIVVEWAIFLMMFQGSNVPKWKVGLACFVANVITALIGLVCLFVSGGM